MDPMAGFKEMPVTMQLGAAVLIAILVGGMMWYVLVKPVNDANTTNQQLLTAKLADNERLRQYERELPALERQIASLQQQLDIQKTIVPDEKEVPEFIHVMQDTAASAGIEVRRYTAKPLVSREFYT